MFIGNAFVAILLFVLFLNNATRCTETDVNVVGSPLPLNPTIGGTNEDSSSSAIISQNVSSASSNNSTPSETTTLPSPHPIPDNQATVHVNLTNVNSTESPHSDNEAAALAFEDDTPFGAGMNGWDFEGMWGKYNLLNSSAGLAVGIPDIPTSKDHVVLVTMDSEGSSLYKAFPALHNATLSLTFFVNCTGKSFLACKSVGRESSNILFNITGDYLENVSLNWFTNTYENGIQNTPFKIMFSFRNGDSPCFWAFDVITVRGFQPVEALKPTVSSNDTSESGEPPILTTTSNMTSENTTTLETTTNATTIHQNTTLPSKENSTIPSNTADALQTNNSTEVVQEAEKQNDPAAEILRIAGAIWDAFYVFLALFCACLIALVILIVRERNRDELVPNTPATYSPRASTYQMGKARENPAYQTDSV